MQRHLPSLSDVFDEQNRLLGISPSHEANGFRFHGAHVGSTGPSLSHVGIDTSTATFRGEQTPSGNPSPGTPFGHSRAPVDGPLPIHALLESKQEPAFEARQPPPTLHGNSFRIERKPLHAHQTLNGGPDLPAINGAPSNHPHQLRGTLLTRMPKVIRPRTRFHTTH